MPRPENDKISTLAGNDSDLRAARRDLLAQVESLREAKARLEKEIAEREHTLARHAEARPPGSSEITLRTIFDATPDAMLVLRLSKPDETSIGLTDISASVPDMSALEAGGGGIPGLLARFVDVNLGFEKQFGVTREEVLGKRFIELDAWMDAETRRKLARELLGRGSVHNMEAELHTKDGRTIPCLLSGTLVEVGGEYYAVGMARDISDLKETQRQLQESEGTFRKLFDANLDRMTIVDLHTGKFIDVNKEYVKASGIPREEIIGKRSRDYSRWANPEDTMRLVQALKDHGEVRNMEVDFLNRDGNPVPCLLSATLVELRGHTCSMTITRDISTLRETQQQLVEAREAALSASRAKSEFLSSMSHEIRTPMNAVLGMADLLAETKLDPEQRKYLSTMINNGNSLLELINDILDLAKVETGRFELERTGFDLAELCDRVCETLAVRAHTKHIELASHIVPGVATNLTGDPLRLRQILINLVGNAIKFTEMGSIVITVEQEAQEDGAVALHFSVADTGIGIPPSHVGKIFESFTQADASTTRKYGGTGLGLAIVKRLVELMGGKIWVESVVGKGSTFHFTARFEVQTEVAAHAQTALAPLDLDGVRTLIVDDTLINRVILREMLGSKGAIISEAENGGEALSKVSRAAEAGEPFALLVLDCRMPGMDGLEVAKRIKAEAGGCRIVTLMLTSDDFSVRTAKLRELGIHAYLVKPIRRTDLYEAIATAMAEVNGTNLDTPAPEKASIVQPQLTEEPGLRILLAEDSPDNRLLIEAYFKKTTHQLDVADNGEIAVRKFTSGNHDVILMDMQMPVMDGYAAVREIRKWQSERGTDHVPIIALTASALKEDVRRSLEAGCDAHVAKPVKKAVLMAAIRDVTEKVRRAGRAHKEPDDPAGAGFFGTIARGPN